MDWIESVLDMIDCGEPDAPSLTDIDVYLNKLDEDHVQIERY